MKVDESKSNKVMRRLSKVISYLIIAFGVLFTFFQLLIFKNWLLAAIGIPIFAFGYSYKRRISRVVMIGEDSVVLSTGNKNIQISNEDILSISKLVRITFTGRFLIKISLKKKGFAIVSSYLVINEPKYNFIEKFQKMGIRLKNIS